MISIGNKRISDSGLIIKPYQHTYLDRYIDYNKKFIFKTFNTTTDNVQKAKILGNIKVELYRQSSNSATINHLYKYYQQPVIINQPCVTPDHWTNPFIYTINNTGHYTQPNSSITSNTYGTHNTNIKNCSKLLSPQLNDVQIGIIQGGDKSKTEFKQSYRQFKDYPSIVYNYNLLPISHKSTDEIYHYCENCGRRIRSKENFCPKCGKQN